MDGRPLPSVDSLRCFVAAAEHLNFRRAAAQVALTPAALSQRIKQLEGQLECRLFERSPRHVELTPAGHTLLARAHAALKELRSCANLIGTQTRSAKLTLGTRFELGTTWIVPALIELRRSHPHWAIDLAFGSGRDILNQLESGKLDAIVTSAPKAKATWRADVLHPEHYCFVATPQRLELAPIQGVCDVAPHPLIDLNEDLPLARYLLSVCPALTFASVWKVGTSSAVRALTLASEGVAVLPEYLIQEDLAAGRLVKLLPEFEPLSDTFRLVYRDASPLVDTLAELANELRSRPLR